MRCREGAAVLIAPLRHYYIMFMATTQTGMKESDIFFFRIGPTMIHVYNLD